MNFYAKKEYPESLKCIRVYKIKPAGGEIIVK
jgi:hypothetical protein